MFINIFATSLSHTSASISPNQIYSGTFTTNVRITWHWCNAFHAPHFISLLFPNRCGTCQCFASQPACPAAATTPHLCFFNIKEYFSCPFLLYYFPPYKSFEKFHPQIILDNFPDNLTQLFTYARPPSME